MSNRPRFERDTTVTRRDDGSFDAHLDRGWWIQRGPNGGYLAAIILRAIVAQVGDPTRHPRSLTVHYLAPADEGPLRIDTTIERTGRSLTSCSARVTQAGRLVALALAACSASRAAPEFADRPRPDAPAAGSLPRSVPPPEVPEVSRRWDWRWVIGSPPMPDTPRAAAAVVGGWIRLDEPQTMDAPVLTAVADGTMPAIFTRVDAALAVPTVDLTVHFRAPLPPPGLPDDGFVFAEFRSQVAADGFLDEDSTIWAPDGALLAQSRQLALILPFSG